MSARGAIENVLNRYSIAYDENDMTEMADTFADGAVLSMRIAGGDLIGPFEGKEAVMKLMTDSLAGQTDQRRHVTTNVVLRKETEDSAVVSSYLTLISVQDGTATLLSTARYEDELVREGDGAWRFTKRHIELDLPY
ncbi:nuclear transport factor 2 family protein [Geodermatophilus marinus]|uniref:nuclear transport factor 2 family protein n=1 Tax=Geodermatophilus sp. LHW52908 TaxID=2303986 RepID=UPI000E3B7D43|nr:nuclear transport factor 2 family protein [Geodermatophilus sp. LHW52908]RFU19135.1 nuclear transport factor 2 family protein [Geodermatophilus sp. LHW52908]